jgi:hypothetical protein
MTTTVPPGDEVTRRGASRRRVEIACVLGIAVKTVFSLALLPLGPSLLGTDPVLLEALRGSASAMASGGAFARVGEASLVLAVLAPLPTLLFATPFFWWAGRLWGPNSVATLECWHPGGGFPVPYLSGGWGVKYRSGFVRLERAPAALGGGVSALG